MRIFTLTVMIVCLVFSLGTIGLFSQALNPEVSLDDNPSAPLTGPWLNPYRSAEDEFGLGLPGALAGFVGPSPSLLLSPIAPLYDSDVLIGTFGPGHALLLRFAPVPPQGSPFYVDAYSCNHMLMPPCGVIFVRFSVDRATGGINPATDATWNQASLNEQPADIFRTAGPGFPNVSFFTGPTAPFFLPIPGAMWPPYYGGPINPANGFTAPPYAFPGPAGIGNQGNLLFFDHAGVFNFLPNAAPYPPITPGSHDNVNGFNEWPFSMVNPNNSAIFFCLHPASAVLQGGFSAADIFYCNQPGGTYWPATGIFAPSWRMGLDVSSGQFKRNTDSIDGLAIWDNGIQGRLEPGIDYAGFTLAPGSATLTALSNAGYPVNAASIFLTDFQINPATGFGYFYVYVYSTDIGVGRNPSPPLPGIPFRDINVDALDLTIDPEPLPYINPITRPNINPVTKK
jgi:hypothetical protein